jgi:hypothetical protein
MKTPSLKTLFRVIGVVLLLFAGLFLLFSLCLVLMAKGDSISSTVGSWPLFGLSLLGASILFLFGAPRLARAIDRRR